MSSTGIHIFYKLDIYIIIKQDDGKA